MKKKLALLLSAIMVVGMIPMTAFATTTNEINRVVTGKADAEITSNEPVLTIKDKDLLKASAETFKLTLTNAEWKLSGISVGNAMTDYPGAKIGATPAAADPGEVEVQLLSSTQAIVKVAKTDISAVQLPLTTTLKGEGDATVTIDPMSSVVTGGTYKFANVVAGATSTTIEKSVDITENGSDIKTIVITEAAGGTIKAGQEITVRLSNDFYFTKNPTITVYPTVGVTVVNNATASDNQELIFSLDAASAAGSPYTISISGLAVGFDADDVAVGDVCDVTVSGAGMTKQTVEVGKAVDFGVAITAENKTLPTFIAGRIGGTSDETLKVTFKETVKGSWLETRKTTMTLPEGVKINAAQGSTIALTDVKGGLTVTGTVDHKDEYSVVTFTATGTRSDAVQFKFKLPLSVAPYFTGDVVAKFGGAGLEEDTEVSIATVIPAVEVTAETNEVSIDYRNVAIGDILITETEAGNLKKGTTLFLELEDISFDGTPVVEVVEGDMKLDKVTVKNGRIAIDIKTASQKTPAVIKVTDLEVYLGRSLPAGSYELSVIFAGAGDSTTTQKLVYVGKATGVEISVSDYAILPATGTIGDDNDKDEFNAMYKSVTSTGTSYDAIFRNYMDPAKGTVGFDTDELVVLEDFVEVVTAGRDQGDETFTTKISVTIGADKLVAGKTEIALDVPAYISEGYTMLPVRAVTEALSGKAIVRWSDEKKEVTITFGARTVGMTVGSKTMNINGVAVQMSKACEITDSRAFIPLRDLGYALGLNDSKINWDDATKTATLN